MTNAANRTIELGWHYGFRIFPQDWQKRSLLQDWPRNVASDSEEIRRLATRYQRANLAIVTGKPSNVLVSDADVKSRKPGADAISQTDADLHWSGVETFRVRTPSGEFRYWVSSPCGVERTSCRATFCGYSGVDFKLNGGCVPLRGGIFECGCGCEHDKDVQPAPRTEGDFWNRIPEVARAYPQINGEASIQEGSRTAELTRIAVGLQVQGLSGDALRVAVWEINCLRCEPWFPESEVHATATFMGRYPASDGRGRKEESRRVAPNAVTIFTRRASEICDSPISLFRAKRTRRFELSLRVGKSGSWKSTVTATIAAAVPDGAQLPVAESVASSDRLIRGAR